MVDNCVKAHEGELGPHFALYHNLAPSANQLSEQRIQLKGTVFSARSTAHNANQSKTRLKHSPVAARGKQRQTFRRRHCRRREAAPKRSLNEGFTRLPANEKQIQPRSIAPYTNPSNASKNVLSVPSLLTRSDTPWADGLAKIIIEAIFYIFRFSIFSILDRTSF